MEFRGPLDRSRRTRAPQAGRRRRAPLGPRARGGAPGLATGRDLSDGDATGTRASQWRGAWIACAAGGLLAALLLVQLRTESIDLRYRLARSLQSEQRLLEEQRRLIVELHQLRHPDRLAELGASLGLARPLAVRELPARAPRP